MTAENTQSENRRMRVSELLAALTGQLAGRGIEHARLKAEFLLADVLACRRLELHAREGEIVGDEALVRLRDTAARTAAGEPVQYVLGNTDFRNCRLTVDRRALIPRPETEQLVQAVIDCTELWQLPRPAIADVGTGSGCIVLALADERPDGRYTATDVGADTLSLAQENARRLGLHQRITWRLSDLLDGFQPETLDAVVSNPPYIPTSALPDLPAEVRLFEPVRALDGGADGLDCIRRLAAAAPVVLRSGGWLFLEIGEEQGENVRRLLGEEPWEDAAILRDLAGRDRFARARKR